jgi:hypothetical protein
MFGVGRFATVDTTSEIELIGFRKSYALGRFEDIFDGLFEYLDIFCTELF